MNKYRIEASVQARNDMLEIWDYIVTELQNPIAAGNLIDEIEKGIKFLATMPKQYKIVDIEPWRSQEIRKVRVKNFYVYYKIYEERSLVAIIMVTYVGRDQDAVLDCTVDSGRQN